MRCRHSLVGAYRLQWVRTHPGGCVHSPDGRMAGWRGYWSCCSKGIPQHGPEGLSFWEILLLNPEAPSIQRRAFPLTQPTSPATPGTVQVRVPHGPTLNSHQPAPSVSLGLALRLYCPPCNFKQPGISGCCSSLFWQGWEPLILLSPKSPEACPAAVGLGLMLPWSPLWSQGCFVLKQSPYLLFFQCPL